jgi:predicted outer membrane repeat protein
MTTATISAFNTTFRRLAAGAAALGCAAALGGAAKLSNAGSHVFYVDKSAPAGGNGASWQTAFRDLNDAILAQTSYRADVEIRVAQGVYTPDRGTGDRKKYFNFEEYLWSAMTLSLQGSFAGLQGTDPDARDYAATRTILSGDLNGDDGPDFANRSDNSCAIVKIGAQQTLAIDGITVRGASTREFPEFVWGAGMIAWVQKLGFGTAPTTLRVTNCNFEENDVTNAPAGGLSAAADSVEVIFCRFIGNRLQDGGGAGLTVTGLGNVYNCVFDSNRARSAGGVYSKDYTYLSMCVFTRNEAEYQGGATFGPIGANSTLFAGNHAGSSGGAIAAFESLGLLSCTIADNSAPLGSAISLMYGSVWIANAVVWGNTGSSSAIRLVDNIEEGLINHSVLQGGSTEVDVSGVPVDFGAQVGASDPRFIRPRGVASAFESWNYRLRSGSPAIGVGGDNWVGYTLDLDASFYRSAYGPADAGCYFDTRYSCEGNLQPGDGVSDDTDFMEFVAAYNLVVSPPANPYADFNRDGLVNDDDFAIFLIGYDRLFCPLPFGVP